MREKRGEKEKEEKNKNEPHVPSFCFASRTLGFRGGIHFRGGVLVRLVRLVDGLLAIDTVGRAHALASK